MLRCQATLLSSGLLARCTAAAGLQHFSTQTHLEPEAVKVQQQLLDAAVKHIKQHGWSQACLVQAARDLQLSPASAGMFPRGASQLVEHVIKQHNNELAQELQASQQQFMSMPLPKRIATAVRKRLEMNSQYIDSWPQALSLLAQPRNSPTAVQLLLQLLDEIWYAAGDTSTDASWYTKRAMLAAIYSSTELYMLTDYSPGFQDTWQQLDRRIQDALWLGSAAQTAAAVPQQLLGLLFQAAGTIKGSGSSSSSSSSSNSTEAAGQATSQGPDVGQEAAGAPNSSGSSSSSSSSPNVGNPTEFAASDITNNAAAVTVTSDSSSSNSSSNSSSSSQAMRA